MSVDSRNARYEWGEDGALEIVSQGTGESIDLDAIMNAPDEDPNEVQPV